MTEEEADKIDLIHNLYADLEEAEDNYRDYQEKYLHWETKLVDIEQKIRDLGYDPNNYPL